MMEFTKKATVAGAMGTLAGAVIGILIDALILIWVCGILLPVCPAIACLASLTYWDWVGLCFGLNLLCQYVGKLFKAVWAK